MPRISKDNNAEVEATVDYWDGKLELDEDIVIYSQSISPNGLFKFSIPEPGRYEFKLKLLLDNDYQSTGLKFKLNIVGGNNYFEYSYTYNAFTPSIDYSYNSLQQRAVRTLVSSHIERESSSATTQIEKGASVILRCVINFTTGGTQSIEPIIAKRNSLPVFLRQFSYIKYKKVG